MTYDNAGNLLTRKKYSYTTGPLGAVMSTQTYTYGDSTWKDRLTGINGTAVTSDAIGNITNDGTWSYVWKNGRQLGGMAKSGTSWLFYYDASGMRTQRTGNGTTYTYTYDGTTLSRMTVGSNTLIFTYGADGLPMAVNYNGTYYYYVTNALGDVTAILNSSGTAVVSYVYDAWGNIISTGGTMASTLGTYNPFRYRSYVYDQETGLYYVSSRYYDPEIGRWISPEPNVYNGEFDEGAGLIGYNVYAYCANNPVNNIDPTGEFVISTAVLIGIGIGALIGGTVGGVYGYKKAVKNNVAKQDRWKYVVGYGLGGAVVGGVIGGFVGYGAGVALGAKASSGLVVKSISKALSSVSRNTMHHIMQSKHAWGQVLKRATWNNVKSLINTTMQKGATTLINKQGNALIYEAVRNNIVVRYAVIDGIIKISDAWVKTR